MSDNTSMRRWLPLSDAVESIWKHLGVSTEVARRALFDTLKDEITQARGDFWDGSNDRTYLKEINSDIFYNNDIDWDNDVIHFDEPMLFPQHSGGLFYSIYKVEVYRDNLDEWLKAHSNREPSESHHESTDVVGEKAVATKSTRSRRRKGGPKPGPYLSHLRKFLKFQLEKKGPGYFDHGIGNIDKDVRTYFRREEFTGRNMSLPTSRSGLQEPIKKWMDENNCLE